MSSMTPGAAVDPAALLAKGRKCYEDVKYPKAVFWFTKAINACPCGVLMSDKICACKLLLEAINEERLDAELRKKCICSVNANRRCKNGTHLDALDGLAATHEARGHIDMAFVAAEAMVNLFPREPKGFLRLGKLLCNKNQYRAAYRTYDQGYELVVKKNQNHPLLPKLIQNKDKIRDKALAVDPLTALPTELAVEIFKLAGFRSICLSTRVSRSWKNFLVKENSLSAVLWRRLIFTPINKAVRLPQMMRYHFRSDYQITELHIGDCFKFGLNCMFLQWMVTRCATLKTLSLCATSISANHTHHLNPMPVSSLRLEKLHIGYYVPISKFVLSLIIESSAKTLEELVILNFNSEAHGPIGAEFPTLSRLRSLHLSSSNWELCADVDLVSFCQKTPNIQELWIDNVFVVFWDTWREYYWKLLKRVFIGEGVSCPSQPSDFPFQITENIEELYLLSFDAVQCLLVIPLQVEEDGLPVLNKLRKFFLADFHNTDPTAQRAEWLQHWLKPSLESGVLEELQINPFPDPPFWMRSKCLKFLGVENISLYSMYPTSSAAVTTALSRFPNVTAIDIFAETLNNGEVGWLIRKNGIKKVYNSRPFYDLEEVRNWARTEGLAELIQKKYIDNVAIHADGFF
ncbi:hypothetical protein F5Y18DRAFT_422008 [Xylariaceae sp. FL1019]|nr:hypothetical protein F5Y18DRAFT_422008 [Xylariaceae sp. FL1019]